MGSKRRSRTRATRCFSPPDNSLIGFSKNSGPRFKRAKASQNPFLVKRQVANFKGKGHVIPHRLSKKNWLLKTIRDFPAISHWVQVFQIPPLIDNPPRTGETKAANSLSRLLLPDPEGSVMVRCTPASTERLISSKIIFSGLTRPRLSSSNIFIPVV